MRRQIFVAVVFAIAASSASAQPSGKPSMEPTAGPFTYEVLGATPSLRMNPRTPRAEPATVASTDRRAAQPAADSSRLAHDENTKPAAGMEARGSAKESKQ